MRLQAAFRNEPARLLSSHEGLLVRPGACAHNQRVKSMQHLDRVSDWKPSRFGAGSIHLAQHIRLESGNKARPKDQRVRVLHEDRRGCGAAAVASASVAASIGGVLCENNEGRFTERRAEQPSAAPSLGSVATRNREEQQRF